MDQPDTEKNTRLKFKQFFAFLFFFLILIPIIFVFSRLEETSSFEYHKTIPLAGIASFILAIWLANLLARRKFGEIEERDQKAEARERRKKINELKESEGYKRRDYARKVMVRYMVLFFVLFYAIAGFITLMFAISGWITFNVALGAGILCAYLTSLRKTTAKYGNK